MAAELEVRADVAQLNSALTRIEGQLDRMNSRANRNNRTLRRLAVSVGAAFSVAAVGAFVLQVARVTSEVQSLRQLLQASGIQDVEAGFTTVLQLAQETRTEISSIGALFSRLSRISGDLGATMMEVEQATRAVAQGLALGGASAAEANSAIIQLSQGLQSGRLQGDELRSVLESAPILAQELATNLGTSVGQLRVLASQGQLTSQRVFDALVRSSENLNERFSDLEPTIGQAFQVGSNGATVLTATIGDAISEALGLVDVFISVGDALTDLAGAREFENVLDNIELITAGLTTPYQGQGILNQINENLAEIDSRVTGLSVGRLETIITMLSEQVNINRERGASSEEINLTLQSQVQDYEELLVTAKETARIEEDRAKNSAGILRLANNINTLNGIGVSTLTDTQKLEAQITTIKEQQAVLDEREVDRATLRGNLDDARVRTNMMINMLQGRSGGDAEEERIRLGMVRESIETRIANLDREGIDFLDNKVALQKELVEASEGARNRIAAQNEASLIAVNLATAQATAQATAISAEDRILVLRSMQANELVTLNAMLLKQGQTEEQITAAVTARSVSNELIVTNAARQLRIAEQTMRIQADQATNQLELQALQASGASDEERAAERKQIFNNEAARAALEEAESVRLGILTQDQVNSRVAARTTLYEANERALARQTASSSLQLEQTQNQLDLQILQLDNASNETQESERRMIFENESARIAIERQGQLEMNLITEQQITEELEKREEIYDRDSATRVTEEANSALGAYATGLGNASNAIQQLGGDSRAAFNAAKALSIAQATINSYLAYTEVLASKEVPEPVKPFLAGSILALGLAQVASIAAQSPPGRQFGGPVSGNQTYQVGENGQPELFRDAQGRQFFIPGDNGRILSNNQAFGDQAEAASQPMVININGNGDRYIADMVEQTITRNPEIVGSANTIFNDSQQGIRR